MQPAPGGGYRSLEINNSPNAIVNKGHTAHWIANSPSPVITIVGAYTPASAVFVDCSLHSDGFTAQYFWGGGAKSIDYLSSCNGQGYGYGTEINQSFGPTSYFGWGVTCSLQTTCSTSSSAGAVLGVHGVRLTAEENTGPSLSADGSNNLWYQSAHWIRGGGWPVGFTATDPSGVCNTDMIINRQFSNIDNSNDSSPDTSSFTQCWPSDSVVGTFDTDYFANGPLLIDYEASNAAAVVSNATETLQVDNTPVSLSLSTPGDPDPNSWVNHAVQVIATASAGPSGLGGTNCSTNDGPSSAYPPGGITVDGTGVWKLSCQSWDNSFDVNGQPATSPVTSAVVHIDETPPNVAFEAMDPADPQRVVADTSDAQSGVSSGQIQMRPAAGGSADAAGGAARWQSLATQFDGSRLIARFNDSGLAPGQWVIRATSCDNAGNCASTDKTLTLPVRTASLSSIGFEKSNRLSAATSCANRPTKVHRRHRRSRRRCAEARVVLTGHERIGFGKPARLLGLLTTGVGAPIGGALIRVLTAPNNGLAQYSQAEVTRTNSQGAWAVRLPAGPSRLIDAVYGGSATIQPSQGWARLTIPASVQVLRVWPRHVPWGGKVHIKARLVGGFLPPKGALVRLRLGYGKAKTTYGVREHVSGNGTFVVTNTFGPGPASLVLHYWLQECTLPEGDYPFAPACGPRDTVTVGARIR
jgi:hypothetical protein